MILLFVNISFTSIKMCAFTPRGQCIAEMKYKVMVMVHSKCRGRIHDFWIGGSKLLRGGGVRGGGGRFDQFTQLFLKFPMKMK